MKPFKSMPWDTLSLIGTRSIAKWRYCHCEFYPIFLKTQKQWVLIWSLSFPDRHLRDIWLEKMSQLFFLSAGTHSASFGDWLGEGFLTGRLVGAAGHGNISWIPILLPFLPDRLPLLTTCIALVQQTSHRSPCHFTQTAEDMEVWDRQGFRGRGNGHRSSHSSAHSPVCIEPFISLLGSVLGWKGAEGTLCYWCRWQGAVKRLNRDLSGTSRQGQ